MSAETDLRLVLVSDAALLALVPAARISIDAVPSGAARPFIVFGKQGEERNYGLDTTLQARASVLEIMVVGADRLNAIAVREAVDAALASAGIPVDNATASFDPDVDAEVETLTVTWWDGHDAPPN